MHTMFYIMGFNWPKIKQNAYQICYTHKWIFTGFSGMHTVHSRGHKEIIDNYNFPAWFTIWKYDLKNLRPISFANPMRQRRKWTLSSYNYFFCGINKISNYRMKLLGHCCCIEIPMWLNYKICTELFNQRFRIYIELHWLKYLLKPLHIDIKSTGAENW